MRVNKAIELLEQRQPIYFEFVDADSAGGYEGGRALAQTWADYITYDMEHSALDVHGLMQFMRGLIDSGPTRSGHRTPAVAVTLPMDGIDAATVRANGWMIKQVLARGFQIVIDHQRETLQPSSEYIYDPKVDLTQLRIRIGMVFDLPTLISMSLFDNIVYGPKLSGTNRKNRLDQTVEKALQSAVL